MGNTWKPMAYSCPCMTKSTTIKKKKKESTGRQCLVVEAILVRSVITDTSVCELSRHIFYAAIIFVLLAFSNFVSYHFLCVQVFTLPSILRADQHASNVPFLYLKLITTSVNCFQQSPDVDQIF